MILKYTASMGGYLLTYFPIQLLIFVMPEPAAQKYREIRPPTIEV